MVSCACPAGWHVQPRLHEVFLCSIQIRRLSRSPAAGPYWSFFCKPAVVSTSMRSTWRKLDICLSTKGTGATRGSSNSTVQPSTWPDDMEHIC